jgi:hypothetical protein
MIENNNSFTLSGTVLIMMGCRVVRYRVVISLYRYLYLASQVREGRLVQGRLGLYLGLCLGLC